MQYLNSARVAFGVKGTWRVIVWAGELVYNLSGQTSLTHTGVGEGSLLIPSSALRWGEVKSPLPWC